MDVNIEQIFKNKEEWLEHRMTMALEIIKQEAAKINTDKPFNCDQLFRLEYTLKDWQRYYTELGFMKEMLMYIDIEKKAIKK